MTKQERLADLTVKLNTLRRRALGTINLEDTAALANYVLLNWEDIEWALITARQLLENQERDRRKFR